VEDVHWLKGVKIIQTKKGIKYVDRKENAGQRLPTA
jgi:hypothetical protein